MQPELTDVRKLLDSTQACTLAFLAQHLPEVGGTDWWQSNVLDNLTILQQKQVAEQRIDSLGGLDLAALLRVLMRNWHELAVRAPLRRNGRTLVHELTDIRNQLAHAPASGLDPNDLERAADTALRYLQLLAASPTDVAAAQALRDTLRRQALGAPPADATPPAAGASPTDEGSGEGEGKGDAPDDSMEVETVPDDRGIPLPWLKPGAQLDDTARAAFESATYVGIDFGTSTSVVSVMGIDPATGALRAEPIAIRQHDRAGRELDQYLIPTCIAWVDGKLLVGSGAAQLKTELTEGKDLWTSFKMQLGVDLGPQYRGSTLSGQQGPETIERPRDAARVFFGTLRTGVEDYVKAHHMPARVRYTVTVPASFEANQRNDLMQSIRDAGVADDDCVLFDEPNAAFLSYLIGMEQKSDGTRFVDGLDKPRRLLVFDFGAGTCDISILEVSVVHGRLTSKNLSISRFWALGGDDIDRAIAKRVLLPQLCPDRKPEDVFSERELERVVLPRLKPVAEELKVACAKYAEAQGLDDPAAMGQDKTPRYGTAVELFTLHKKRWELQQPSMSLARFAEVLQPFLEEGSDASGAAQGAHSVLEPIDSALEKIDAAADDLDMLLFIGGSSENPLVRHAVRRHVGRFVDCVSPRDMRSHVSQGAAANSFFVHGLGYTPIRPITSENIFVITREGGMALVLRAGSPVPSADINITELTVEREDQDLIELPFCVSSRDKLLGVVSIEPPASGMFKQGTKVRVSCKVTRDKLLDIRVRAGARASHTSLLNPLSNRPQSAGDTQMLEAERAFNVATLAGHGRPSAAAALAYARCARSNGHWRKAAEMFEAVQQLDPDADHSISIDYCYAMAKDWARSAKWSRVAYQRAPSATSAYNYALSVERAGNKARYAELMEEALRRDRSHTAALCVYGHSLIDAGDARGHEYVTHAYDLLLQALRTGELDDLDRRQLRQCARTLGKTAVLAELDRATADSSAPIQPYSEDNLVAGGEREQHARGA